MGNSPRDGCGDNWSDSAYILKGEKLGSGVCMKGRNQRL